MPWDIAALLFSSALYLIANPKELSLSACPDCVRAHSLVAVRSSDTAELSPCRYVPMFGETDFRVEQVYASAPLEEQLEALGRAVEAGKVCQVGLSNETPWGLMECCRLGGATGYPTHHCPQDKCLHPAQSKQCTEPDRCCGDELSGVS